VLDHQDDEISNHFFVNERILTVQLCMRYLRDMAKQRKSVGRPPENEVAMTATIPLRLPQEYLDQADNVIEERYGAGSRNSVLREMIARGFEAYFAERKGKK
jgi:hypothetical protein